jgi:hypothetical protein
MTSPVAAPPSPVDAQYLDARSADYDCSQTDPDDAPGFDAAKALAKAEAREQLLRTKLAQVKTRRGVYQEVVLCAYAHLPHARARLLCVMVNKARADLSNYFFRRTTLAAELQIPLGTLSAHLDWLARQGWIRRYPFRRRNGQQSSSGVQFRLPAGVLGAAAWEGPVEFSEHRGTVRRRRRPGARRC